MRKITVFLALMLAIIIVPGVIFAQAVSTQEQFITTIEEGKTVEITKNVSIKLEKDITITGKVTIGAYSGTNNTVTLDLNGHTVKLDGSSAQFFIQKTGTLIIEDSAGNGLITNAGATANSQYPIQVKGKLQINGGTLENALPNIKTVYIQDETSTCTLNSGTIKNSYEKGGRAVNLSKGTFIINGGKVENKAAGSDGLVPAIEGHKVIMTGGTIEAAGTGITATGQSVEITGGTINAGSFGLHTRYANINPAEGKEVNINAGRAAIIAYSAPTSGKENKIYGGKFDAPILMESKYVSDPTNVEVYGGLFTHDVAEYVVPGHVINKINNMYEVKVNTPNIVDEEFKEDEELEIGVVPELQEKLEEIFKQEIEENEKIKEALLEGKSVNIYIQMEKVEEKEVKEEELNAIKETSKDKKIAKFYDITLVVKADDTQIDTISEISNKLKFKALIPEELIKDGRTFFMYRYHDGKNGGEVEEITGEVTEDNYFVFESDRFSTYVLAYEDKVEEQQPEQDNTGNEGAITPPAGDEDNSDKGEVEQQPEQDNTDNEGTVTPPVEEDNTGKGEAEQQPEDKQEDKTEVKPTTTDVPKTGDNVVLYVALAAVAVMGIFRVKKLNVKNRKH